MTFSTSPGVGFTVSKNENIFHKEKSVLKYVERTNDLRKKFAHSDSPKQIHTELLKTTE